MQNSNLPAQSPRKTISIFSLWEEHREKGCYCFVNGLLQNQLAKLYPNYPFMVVDNEAGMEHISRGILPGMDTAILVSDCSRRGVQAAARIAELIKECDMKPKQVGLIVNRAPNGVLNEGTREEIEKQGLTLLALFHTMIRFMNMTVTENQPYVCRKILRYVRH